LGSRSWSDPGFLWYLPESMAKRPALQGQIRTKEMTHEWNLDFPNAINSIAVPYCVTKKLCFKMQSLAEFKGKRHENNSWSIAHRWHDPCAPDPMVPPPKVPKSKVRWHGLRRALSAMRVTLNAEKDWKGWMFEVSTLNSTL
jgi:hypothetical protein